MNDLLEHVAEVYLHKVECTRRLADPEPWPPDFGDRDRLELFNESYETLRRELIDRGPDARSYTWWPADQSVGFWYRRMAQETAIHRVDVEAAHDVITPVPPDLAADGIDEVLMLMLAGDWADEPVEEADGKVIDFLAGGRIWRVTLGMLEVLCVEQAPGRALPDTADASISGDASDLLLWMWGRGRIDPLSVTGDSGLAAAVRRRLELATQ